MLQLFNSTIQSLLQHRRAPYKRRRQFLPGPFISACDSRAAFWTSFLASTSHETATARVWNRYDESNERLHSFQLTLISLTDTDALAPVAMASMTNLAVPEINWTTTVLALIPVVTIALGASPSARKWVWGKYYQYEVTLSVYMMNRNEKIVFSKSYRHSCQPRQQH